MGTYTLVIWGSNVILLSIPPRYIALRCNYIAPRYMLSSNGKHKCVQNPSQVFHRTQSAVKKPSPHCCRGCRIRSFYGTCRIGLGCEVMCSVHPGRFSTPSPRHNQSSPWEWFGPGPAVGPGFYPRNGSNPAVQRTLWGSPGIPRARFNPGHRSRPGPAN